MKTDTLLCCAAAICFIFFAFIFSYTNQLTWKIDINYFVAIAAFYGVVLGFLVPFSKQEIRETRLTVPEHLLPDFDTKTNIIYLTIHLSIGLFFNVSFILLFTLLKEKTFFIICILLIFIHFLYLLIQVFQFTKALHTYTNPINIFDILEQEVSDVIKK